MGREYLKTIYKPWGKEEWIELNEFYCYKRIYINKGYKTSFQYHNKKVETTYVISGEAEIWLENEDGVIEKKLVTEGDFYNVKPPRKHRVIALTDLIIQEVSTPEVDDVIRIEDDMNRPDGKIDDEHMKPAVLILCAGLGERLKHLTKNINKCLLPIKNKAIISHIINLFPNNYDFVIALGYKGDIIKDYCNITHPEHNFIFVEIDKYHGENSGPGYSALMCSKYLQRPFYVIMGDCLIDSPLPPLDGNWMGVHPTAYPEKYATINIEGDNIIDVLNKNKMGYDLASIGLSAIYDYKIFWNELENNLYDGEFICAFTNPKKYPSLKIKNLKWIDTGNLDDLQKARDYFNDEPLSLKKDTDEITYHDNDKFLKFTPNKDILKNRIDRAKFLNESIPNNFGYTDNFIYYDWVIGKTPYEFDRLDIYVNFLNVFQNKLKNKINGNIDDVMSFYVEKTKKRFDIFIEKYGMNYSNLEHQINGIIRKSMNTLLFDNDNFRKLEDNQFYTKFHGDLHFENMVYNEDENKYYYIDWRDSFGQSVEYGDTYYDLSKLYGGLLIPYNLMKDENNIIYEEGIYTIKYSYPISENLTKFKTIYENWLIENGYDMVKIKFITALIFLNMSPLHDGKFGKMLWFKSIEMLDDLCVK